MTKPSDHSDGIRCMLMRGGSSKGAYFVAGDLPADPAERDPLLLDIMGSPDARQVDGIGGAHPLTSKVAIVSASPQTDVDVDYLFLQVGVTEPVVSDQQNCGNLLAGVGPFALERGLVRPRAVSGSSTMQVRIRMVNTNSIAVAQFRVTDGKPHYHASPGEGVTVSGVPGTASPITVAFEGIEGSSCGALLPTGTATTTIDGVPCTLIDNGMPVVVMAASDLGISGYETCPELEANTALRARLESIRLQAGPLMNLGDVTNTTVPKLTMVSPPRCGGALNTRTFIPHRCHDAIGVLGAVSVASAALLSDSPAGAMAHVSRDYGQTHIELEHPTGSFTTSIETSPPLASQPLSLQSAGIVRTARKILDGVVFPRH